VGSGEEESVADDSSESDSEGGNASSVSSGNRKKPACKKPAYKSEDNGESKEESEEDGCAATGTMRTGESRVSLLLLFYEIHLTYFPRLSLLGYSSSHCPLYTDTFDWNIEINWEDDYLHRQSSPDSNPINAPSI